MTVKSNKIVASAMKAIKGDKEEEAKEFINKVKESKETFNRVHDKFYAAYRINGKIMPEWQDYFKIDIPKDISPIECIGMLAELAAKYHEASFYYSSASALDKAYGSEREKEYRKVYRRVTDERTGTDKKTAAATTLATLADQEVQEFDDVIYNAQLTKDFWKSILDQLKYSFKVLNDITINNSLELKMEMKTG